MDNPATPTEGNQDLGIARFEVTTLPTETTIVGYDAQDQVVASVDLKLGSFRLGERWAEDRTGDAMNVEGRRMSIHFDGLQDLYYEGVGYPTLHMPLMHGRAEYFPLRQFLADSHVEPILSARGVNFEAEVPAALAMGPDGESAYGYYDTGWFSAYGAAARNYGTGTGGHHGDQYACMQINLSDAGTAWGTNACNAGNSGANYVDSCSVSAQYQSGYPNNTFNYTEECCYNSSTSTLSFAVKTCVTQSGGVSGCGTGGSLGCAPCVGWAASGISSCITWCQGLEDGVSGGHDCTSPEGSGGTAFGNFFTWS